MEVSIAYAYMYNLDRLALTVTRYNIILMILSDD